MQNLSQKELRLIAKKKIETSVAANVCIKTNY